MQQLDSDSIRLGTNVANTLQVCSSTEPT